MRGGRPGRPCGRIEGGPLDGRGEQERLTGAAGRERPSSKTTVKEPSERSPYSRASSVTTRSESVRGTEKLFESSAERRGARESARDRNEQPGSQGRRGDAAE